jgi:hypothetical protein
MLRNRSAVQVCRYITIMSLIIGASCVPATTDFPPTELEPTLSQSAGPSPTVLPPTRTATQISPSPTPKPTETPLPPTEEPVSRPVDIVVPPGSAATIDGILDPGEWIAALQVDFADESQLFLMHADGYLYLGIKGKPEPVTSICVDQGAQVSILHSSAALGTAVYQIGDEVWNLVREFEWCCRETTDSPQAREALDRHLQEEGWVANNGLRGTPEEVEFQILMPEGSLRLAVNAIGPPSYRSVVSWPEGLEDDCSRLSMITGPIPEEAQFSMEDWVTLTASVD